MHWRRNHTRKTAVTLSAGNTLTLDSEEGPAQILYMSSTAIHETRRLGRSHRDEYTGRTKKAFSELKNNTFLKEKTTYK